MLGEAMPHVAPELHRSALAMIRYGDAWVRKRNEWLEAAGIAYTNCFTLRPNGNKIEALCETKKENKQARPELQIARGSYLQECYLPELTRLQEELATARPNLVVCCGNTAAWATLRANNISQIRGAVAAGVPAGVCPGVKCLPTYHPAGVLRQWQWRPVVVADLMKAEREMEFPEIRRPDRHVLVNPTLDDCARWKHRVLAGPKAPAVLSCDIETVGKMIRCVGFACSRSDALVIPFIDPARPEGHYWPTTTDELEAWQIVRELLESPIPKLFQNGLYDLQYLLRMGMRPKNCLEDTMLLHHSLFPEMLKGLGFLGSVYTNEASWKLMRRFTVDTLKKDE
jgi:hypothetical protein